MLLLTPKCIDVSISIVFGALGLGTSKNELFKMKI